MWCHPGIKREKGEMIVVKTLSREDVIRVIEGKGAAERIPLFYDFYI